MMSLLLMSALALVVAVLAGLRMADLFGSTLLPGPGAVSITNERSALLGPITWYLLKGVVINGSASSDAGNTPTTELRHGLLMGMRTADGFAGNYGPTATDGTQVVAGFLWEARSTIDNDGLTVNRTGQLVIAGWVRATQLILLDEQARRQMQGRFIFDDRSCGVIGGYRQTLPKTANYTVVAGTDNDTLFTTTGAGGEVDFTLPAPAVGNRFRFYNTVDQVMKVIAPAGKLVAFNNAAATSVAFSTAGQKIGGAFEVVADDTGSKWLVHDISAGANTVTVA